MKYIRRFDESYGYDPTDGMVFYEDKDWAKIEDFRWRILDYLESNNYPVKHKIENYGDNKIQMLYITSTNYMFIKTLSSPRLELTPMEITIAVDSDEWFYVELTSNEKRPFDKKYLSTVTTKTNHYKCDQLEGLLELLKDKVIRSK
jgi:hypothetical protein